MYIYIYIYIIYILYTYGRHFLDVDVLFLCSAFRSGRGCVGLHTHVKSGVMCNDWRKPYEQMRFITVHDKLCTLNSVFRWTQQLDGLYPLQYFFLTWHRQHALYNAVHIPSHASRVQHL
jgi:hypothetical protein